MHHENRFPERRAHTRASVIAMVGTAAAALAITVTFGDWHAKAATGTAHPEQRSGAFAPAGQTSATATGDATVPSAADVLDRTPANTEEPPPTF